MDYSTLKSQNQTRYDNIMKECRIFWAFNQEQLKEGIKKSKISKDNKMVSIGAGGYMPSKNLDKFFSATKEADLIHKKALKDFKQERASAIDYELNNYECYYTTDLTPVFELFKGVYTQRQIKAVYNNNVL